MHLSTHSHFPLCFVVRASYSLSYMHNCSTSPLLPPTNPIYCLWSFHGPLGSSLSFSSYNNIPLTTYKLSIQKKDLLFFFLVFLFFLYIIYWWYQTKNNSVLSICNLAKFRFGILLFTPYLFCSCFVVRVFDQLSLTCMVLFLVMNLFDSGWGDFCKWKFCGFWINGLSNSKW